MFHYIQTFVTTGCVITHLLMDTRTSAGSVGRHTRRDSTTVRPQLVFTWLSLHSLRVFDFLSSSELIDHLHINNRYILEVPDWRVGFYGFPDSSPGPFERLIESLPLPSDHYTWGLVRSF